MFQPVDVKCLSLSTSPMCSAGAQTRAILIAFLGYYLGAESEMEWPGFEPVPI